jgi:hypothetical protein
MRIGVVVPLLAAILISAHAGSAGGQRAASVRVAAASSLAARQQPLSPTVSDSSRSAIPRWPFVLVGAAAGAALAARSVSRSEKAAGGDDFFPQIGVGVIVGGTALGALGGFVVGSILREATK